MSAQPVIRASVTHSGPLFAVLNRRSGSCDDATTERIVTALQPLRREIRFVEAADIGVPAAVDQAVQLATRHDGAIVAIGGDGTINASARAAMAAGRPLGIVPQGTFNYFARELGIPLDATEAARVLGTGRRVSLRLGCVNGQPFLVNASLGLYPQLLEDRETFTRRLGRNRLVAIAGSLWSLWQQRHQLTMTGEGSGGGRTPTVFVGRNRQQFERLGLPDELLDALDDERLVALTMQPITGGELFGLVVRGAIGRLGDADRLHRFAFRELAVQPRRRRRVRVAIDGEIVRLATPVRFGLCPQPLSVIVPAEPAVPRD